MLGEKSKKLKSNLKILATVKIWISKFIKGTKMNFAGLKNVEDRANIILWMRSNSDDPLPLP